MRFALVPITMELTETQREQKIKKAEKLIMDNIKPDCPLCDSDLEISKKQQGESGAFAYKYRCSNDACHLRPYRTIYTPWYIAVAKAFRNSLIGLLFTAAGSITLAGFIANGAGLISFNWEDKKTPPQENRASKTKLSATNPPPAKPSNKASQKEEASSEPKPGPRINTNPISQEESLPFIDRYYLALYLSNPGVHQNLSLAKRYFMEVLTLNQSDIAENELSDNDKDALIIRLRERPFGFDEQEIKQIISYIQAEGVALENRYYHLVTFYNKLYTETSQILYKYRELESYLKHCSTANTEGQIKEELKSVLTFMRSSKSLDWTEIDQSQILNAINTPSASATLALYIQKLQPYIEKRTSSQ